MKLFHLVLSISGVCKWVWMLLFFLRENRPGCGVDRKNVRKLAPLNVLLEVIYGFYGTVFQKYVSVTKAF
jgi:hypothetical protein